MYSIHWETLAEELIVNMNAMLYFGLNKEPIAMIMYLIISLTRTDRSASGSAEDSTMRLANRNNTPVESCIFLDVLMI